MLAFAAAGVAIAFIGLTYSELVAAMPRAGGEHVYTHAALGLGWSFVCTWALLMAYAAVCLFESVALPTAIEYLWPEIRGRTLWHVAGAPVHFGFVATGVIAAIVMTWINVIGIRTAAFVQTAITGAILLAGIVLIVGAGTHGEWSNAQPLIAVPATGVLSVLIMVPALMVGFDVLPQSAEENRPAAEPHRLAPDRIVGAGRAVVRRHFLRRRPRIGRGRTRCIHRGDRGRGHGALERPLGRRAAHRRGRRRHPHELERLHHLR